jgi:integrase
MEDGSMSVRKRKWTTRKGEERTAWVLDYVDRKGNRILETFQRKKDADERASEVAHDIKTGTHVPRNESITVAEAGTQWIEQAEIDKLQRTTITQYRQHLDLHINHDKWGLGYMKLADLTAPDISHFEKALAQAGVSEAMRRKVRTSLGSLIAQAMQDGYINRNVVRDGKRRKMRKVKKKRLEVGTDIPTPEEIRKLLETVEGRFRPFFITAVFTGMRASELRGLCWPEVDFKKNAIHVRQRADRHNVIDAPKSEAGTRTIPVGPFVMNTLKVWKLQCGSSEHDLVFPTTTGKIQNHSNIRQQQLIPLMKKAGIVDKDKPKYTGLHALRHFYASWLINSKEDGGQGLPPKVVQDRMGHSTLAMTTDTYSHLFPRGDDLKEIQAAESALVGT